MKHTYELFYTYPNLKISAENSSCEIDNDINGPRPSRGYSGRPKIVEDLGFINLSTMDTIELTQELYNMVANYVSKLFMINASG